MSLLIGIFVELYFPSLKRVFGLSGEIPSFELLDQSMAPVMSLPPWRRLLGGVSLEKLHVLHVLLLPWGFSGSQDSHPRWFVYLYTEAVVALWVGVVACT
jgi:hypothetical protein